MPSAVARLVRSSLLLGLLTALAFTGFAGTGEDPRNSGEFYAAVGGVNCWDCHAPSWYHYEPAPFYVEEGYSEVPVGTTVNVTLVVRHILTVPKPAGLEEMEHAMQDMAVTVDTSQAPHVAVVTDGFLEDVFDEAEVVLDGGDRHEMSLIVHPDAATFSLRAYAPDAPAHVGLVQDGLRIAAVSPTERRFTDEGTATDRTLVLDEADLDAGGSGEYRIIVFYDHPVPSAANELSVRLEWSIVHRQTQTSFRFDVPGGDIRGGDPQVDQWRRLQVPLRVVSEGDGVIDFRLEVINFWPHSIADDVPGDEGLFYRFDTLRLASGDSLVLAAGGVVEAPVPPASVEWQHLFTRILGFATMLLIPLAMVTGGIFGKASRRLLNRWTGGAQRRVLWHNVVSTIIIGVACIHFVLALVDGRSSWTRGLFWGGFGWALLVSLGFTGFYQVRIIKRWDYATWRRVHLGTAVSVLGFGLVHMVLEGGDTAFLRDHLPKWHEWLVWP